ncbi:proline--tRNA ligase [Spirochaeta isovalerica]|uniref:Proline--tRNA ligase n=1 Tax=Spirochaeta isovalerica TaxID=150 RepID=A0A841RHX0_9SPIO|nr:proline--tRNA ligase [Spirochaeta isovalerica]MBB6482359.1 prolyl-tRNA synthetase [Spirochaeta isovalerica]
MRISRMFYRTMKEVPKEASIPSHQLMFRAGMIQQVSSGIYNYLPLALKSIRKIERIIRDVLVESGCEEVLLPVVQPAELWKESGRWEYYGDELLRFTDRKDNEFCLGPTHEEVITDMVRRNLKSYKQLPWNIFQIQTKFRDEIRPRFGLMRGREFIMKDGYSFDTDSEASRETYYRMYKAYEEIFRRTGVDFKAVEALTGNIGGSLSHEFQVLADSGEDLIISCPRCAYAANAEKARTVFPVDEAEVTTTESPADVHTPGAGSIEEVSAFLDRSPRDFIKSLLYRVDGKPVLVLLRGDREVNEAKLLAVLQGNTIGLADEETVQSLCGTETGYVGPVGLNDKVPVLADRSVEGRSGMVCGANRKDYHKINVCWERDYKAEIVDDFSFARSGDPCPECGAKLEEFRGIEVGQVFHLGTKYSESMNCTFLDSEGKEQPVVMGCYGIGVGRTMAAAIEQNHDESGIVWPVAIAPYEVVVMPLQMNSSEVIEAGEKIYRELLEGGIDALIDDREERAGFKFNDADLVGYPLQIGIGRKSLEKGVLEIKIRKTGEKLEMSPDAVVSFVSDFLGREKVK